MAMRRGTPCIWRSTVRTSSRVSTTGSRAGRFARTTSSSHGRSCLRTPRYGKRSALSAWFWVDAATLLSTASELRNFVTSSRMALAMEEDEAADPCQVGTLGAPAVMLDARGFPDAVEEPRRAGGRWVGLTHRPHGAGRAGIPDPSVRPSSHALDDSPFPCRTQGCGGIDTAITLPV